MNWLLRLAANPINYWFGFVLDIIVAALLIARGGAHPAAIAAGIVGYTFYEYAFHRWLYHSVANPVRSLHAIHHRDRAARLGAPFFFTMTIAAITWALASLVVDPDVAAVFTGTVLGGYAFQSAVHHVAHGWTGTYRLRGRLVQRWRRHHLLHHRDGDVNFGIMTTMWDQLFGTHDVTRKPRGAVRRSRSG